MGEVTRRTFKDGEDYYYGRDDKHDLLSMGIDANTDPNDPSTWSDELKRRHRKASLTIPSEKIEKYTPAIKTHLANQEQQRASLPRATTFETDPSKIASMFTFTKNEKGDTIATYQDPNPESGAKVVVTHRPRLPELGEGNSSDSYGSTEAVMSFEHHPDVETYARSLRYHGHGYSPAHSEHFINAHVKHAADVVAMYHRALLGEENSMSKKVTGDTSSIDKPLAGSVGNTEFNPKQTGYLWDNIPESDDESDDESAPSVQEEPQAKTEEPAPSSTSESTPSTSSDAPVGVGEAFKQVGFAYPLPSKTCAFCGETVPGQLEHKILPHWGGICDKAQQYLSAPGFHKDSRDSWLSQVGIDPKSEMGNVVLNENGKARAERAAATLPKEGQDIIKQRAAEESEDDEEEQSSNEPLDSEKSLVVNLKGASTIQTQGGQFNLNNLSDADRKKLQDHLNSVATKGQARGYGGKGSRDKLSVTNMERYSRAVGRKREQELTDDENGETIYTGPISHYLMLPNQGGSDFHIPVPKYVYDAFTPDGSHPRSDLDYTAEGWAKRKSEKLAQETKAETESGSNISAQLLESGVAPGQSQEQPSESRSEQEPMNDVGFTVTENGQSVDPAKFLDRRVIPVKRTQYSPAPKSTDNPDFKTIPATGIIPSHQLTKNQRFANNLRPANVDKEDWDALGSLTEKYVATTKSDRSPTYDTSSNRTGNDVRARVSMYAHKWHNLVDSGAIFPEKGAANGAKQLYTLDQLKQDRDAIVSYFNSGLYSGKDAAHNGYARTLMRAIKQPRWGSTEIIAPENKNAQAILGVTGQSDVPSASAVDYTKGEEMANRLLAAYPMPE